MPNLHNINECTKQENLNQYGTMKQTKRWSTTLKNKLPAQKAASKQPLIKNWKNKNLNEWRNQPVLAASQADGGSKTRQSDWQTSRQLGETSLLFFRPSCPFFLNGGKWEWCDTWLLWAPAATSQQCDVILFCRGCALWLLLFGYGGIRAGTQGSTPQRRVDFIFESENAFWQSSASPLIWIDKSCCGGLRDKKKKRKGWGREVTGASGTVCILFQHPDIWREWGNTKKRGYMSS